MKPSKKLIRFCSTMGKALEEFRGLTDTDKALIEARFKVFRNRVNSLRNDRERDNTFVITEYYCLLELAGLFPRVVYWQIVPFVEQ